MAKPTSARKIIALTITFTYCLVILGICALAINKTITVDKFIGLFGGFSTLVLAIIHSYFSRTDRKKEESSE